MQKISFTKMQGLGNDFVVIDGINQNINLTKTQIICLADRHYGIGFDQLLLLEPDQSGEADFIYRIFNADGSEVSQCGNGARCIAKFAVEHQLVDSYFIQAKTKKGILELKVEEDGKVTVNMGEPHFEPEAIPLSAPFNNDYWIESIPTAIYPKGHIKFQAVSVGNPHAIIWIDNQSDYDFKKIGEFLNAHSIFPAGVNVSFAKLIDTYHLDLNVYERGVGLTLACGSAACAVACAGIVANQCTKQVLVSQSGGDLEINWQGNGHAIYMSGPAETVFEGIITL